MKIVYLHDNFPPEKYGGAAGICFDMAEYFYNSGNEVIVITTTKDKIDEGVELYKGIRVYKIYSNYHERWRSYLSLYNPATVSKIDKILKEEIPDVVHAHNIHYHLSYYALKLAKRYSKKVFLTAHDVGLINLGKAYPVDPATVSFNNIKYNIYFWTQLRGYKWRFNPFRSIFIKYLLQNVDKIFSVSNALKEVLESRGIKNIETIHNGMSSNGWNIPQEKISSFKEEHNLDNKKILLLSGRISNAKGGIQILECLSILNKEFTNLVLVILSKNDGYVDRLLDGNNIKKATNNIYYPGWSEGEKLKLFYMSCDIVVVPSVCFDSFPNVNLEAMLASKPIVATCFGGSKEIILDNKTGFIDNPNDILSFANKIRILLKNNEMADKFGEIGHNLVIDKFSLKNQMDMINFWYREDK